MLAAMKPKGACDVPLRQDPARTRAADDDSCRCFGTNARQCTCSQPAATDCRAVEARAARGAGCADCALSRRTAGECAGGVDLSARSGAGRSLAQSAQDLERRRVEEGGRETVL